MCFPPLLPLNDETSAASWLSDPPIEPEFGGPPERPPGKCNGYATRKHLGGGDAVPSVDPTSGLVLTAIYAGTADFHANGYGI
jgi:hypothetical protein